MLLLALVACDRQAPVPGGPRGDFVETEPALAVTPARVDFGVVLRGEAASVEVELANVGASPLRIDDLALADAPPGLVVADLGTILVQPGEATTLAVELAPTELGAWSTTLTIATNDPATPRFALPIAGEGAGPALEASMASYPFGAVPVGCTERVTVPFANVGTHDLVVTGLSLDGGPEWSVAGTTPDVPPPWTLAPGRGAEVVVAFAPAAPEVATATLSLASNDPTGPAAVTFSAAGTYGETVEDTFVQPTGAASYVLAVDVTASTADEVARLDAALPALLDALDGAGLPYRVGVVAGEDGCLAGGLPLVDDTSPRDDQLAALRAMLAAAASPWAGQGFTLLDAATSAANLAPGGCNEGLVVGSDALALIGLTDVAESSARPWSDYVAGFAALVATPDDLRVHAIAGDWPSGCDGADAGAGWYEATVATGGTFASVCAADYEAALAAIAAREGLRDRFELSAAPVPDTLAVTIDGAPLLSGWTYAAGDNVLAFDAAPPSGATVAARYATYGACE